MARTLLALALLASAARGLLPSRPLPAAARLGRAGAARAFAPRPAKAVAAPTMGLLGALARPAVAQTARVVGSLPVLYSLMSVNEYWTHRYFQHAEFNRDAIHQFLARHTFRALYALRLVASPKVPNVRGGGHVEHHAETLDDMTLKTDARWRATKVAKSLDDDVYRGTAFTWSVTGAMTIQMLFTTLPVFMGLLRFRFVTTMAILLPGMLVHALVWNALHPNMHALPDVPLRDGAPSWVFAPLRSTWFFRYLYQNHEGHHVAGGQANYNVACPGTDHLVGTYLREKVWRPRATTSYLSHHGEELSMEQQVANHIAREKFGVKPTPVIKPTPTVAFTNQTQVLDLA